ncbi:glycosyltransferase family 2 protein [Raoultella sp. HC6]|uniref:glycosyltransferase family 2 protein n=1 Tax=Raoultella sp. HC6 TaxID=2923366 RepID=UPI001F50D11C|nr:MULTISPECIES: glycosyltransferase family 2 protein [Raoultella]
MKQPKLAIVVPCYNEEAVFSQCLSVLRGVIAELISATLIAEDSYILFVDDGSRDSTWQLIAQASMDLSMVRGVKLSRNRGHQIALLAGLEAAEADITVSIDADLQDDTAVIALMVKEYLNGNEIVYGVRNDRTSDSPFKRKTASLFYGCMKWMGVQQVPQHADFRLLSNRAKKALLSFKEQNLYLRGLVPLIGYRSTQVAYSRTVRVAGESKYPLKKMIALAIEGITSLTITPLRIIAVLGFAISILSACAALYALFEKFTGNTVEGWTSVMIAIFFLGGVQMLSLGIIGEYVGKIYMESKGRPKYFIEKTTQQKVDNE